MVRWQVRDCHEKTRRVILVGFFVPDVDASRHFRPFRAVAAARYSFGIIPTLLVRLQCCGSAGSPATSDRPTARSRWLCWRCAQPRRADRSSQTCLGACCWTRLRRGRWASLCPLAWSSSVPKRKEHPERRTVGSEQSGKRKPNKHVVSGHSEVLSDDVGLAASAVLGGADGYRNTRTPSCDCAPIVWFWAPSICEWSWGCSVIIRRCAIPIIRNILRQCCHAFCYAQRHWEWPLRTAGIG